MSGGPLPEPKYKHGEWYLDADGIAWQFRAAGRFWCTVAGCSALRVAFSEPRRFPDGSLHHIADGGRP